MAGRDVPAESPIAEPVIGAAAPDKGQAVVDKVHARYLERTPGSRELHRRASAVLPGGDTRTTAHFAPYPTYMERGAGCRLWDVDGNEYVDALNNFTSLVHGHAHPEVTNAIVEHAACSTAHGLPVEGQVALAEAICERFPSVERLRFGNSGTEAVMMAIRAARAFTGRSTIVKMEGGYHGMYDSVRVSVQPAPDAVVSPMGIADDPGLSPGLTGEVLVAPFNGLSTTVALLRERREQIAAVIVEPVLNAAGAIPAEHGFLAGLREATSALGILLILDEVVTLRLGWGGAQGLYGVRPDLTCFGKSIGGGLPVGAFGGRADVMAAFDPGRPNVIAHSGTYNANAATMAAGLATLRLLTPQAFEHLDRLGRRARDGFQAVLDDAELVGHVTGAGSLLQIHLTAGPVRDYRSAARSNRKATKLLHLALLNRGVVCASRGMFNLSTVMAEADVDRLIATLKWAVEEVGPAVGYLATAPAS